MIQVQAVRALPDVGHHAVAEQCVGHRGSRVDRRSNDGDAGHANEEETAAEQDVVSREPDIGDVHHIAKHRGRHRQTSQTEEEYAVEQLASRADRRGLQQPRPPKHRQCGTQEQTTGTREGAEEEEVDSRHGLAEECHELFGGVRHRSDGTTAVGERREYRDCDRCCDEQHADDGQSASTELHQCQHDDRPEHVELFFHRQRPEVTKRNEVECREVRGAYPDLEPVEAVQQRSDDVATQVAKRVTLENGAVHRNEEEQHPQCRQQSASAPHPELFQADAAIALRLRN